MIEQILLAKKMFLIGVDYSEKNDPISAGLAISMFQDSIETLTWIVIKDKNITVRDNEPFIKFFNLIYQKTKQELPLQAKILELNKARVNFKHYGNLPNISEAIKFKVYAEDFLKQVSSDFLSKDFDKISLIDLVVYEDIRDVLKAAQQHHNNKDYQESVQSVSTAKSMLFSKMANFFPEVDSGLSSSDNIFRELSSSIKPFKYIADYLKISREQHILAILGIPLKEFILVKQYLPQAIQVQSGKWNYTHRGLSVDIEKSQKAIDIITNIAIKANYIVGD